MNKVIQGPAKILTEEELNKCVKWGDLNAVIASHRSLLSANAELSFKNNKLAEELKSAKEMLVQSEVRRITESGLLK